MHTWNESLQNKTKKWSKQVSRHEMFVSGCWYQGQTKTRRQTDRISNKKERVNMGPFYGWDLIKHIPLDDATHVNIKG